MSVKEHVDYPLEVERLEYTKDYIDKTIKATDEYRDTYKGNIKDAMVELDYLDSSQSYIEIILNTKFMEIAERNYNNLKKVEKKPYFARIDFKRKGSEEIERLYIGKVSLSRAEDEMPLILDWRSPMADIYYEGRLGNVSYKTETQIEEGELILKRQFMIENGEIKEILDIDITANDVFLQASLEANVDNKLKDIASTIQAEQNKVIRAPMEKALIVQGVAGSGKTTIALHRIAYFMYKYEKTFEPDTFMVIAPNKLFINYISEVLPELGVESIRQTTFTEFMLGLIGKKFRPIDGDVLLKDILSNRPDIDMERWLISYKGSLRFKDMILRYIGDIESNYTPKADFKIGDFKIEDFSTIEHAIIKDYSMFPLYKRVDKLKENLRGKLRTKKSDILTGIEDSYNDRIDALRERPDYDEDMRLRVVSLLEERDATLKTLSKELRTALNKYIKLFEKRDAIEYYRDLVTNSEMIMYYSDKTLTEDQARYMSKRAAELFSEERLQVEDYPALALIKHKVHGFKDEINIRSVVIDEAQDFSLFQFYVLKHILNTDRFTILGDISQGIHSYRAIDSWESVINNIFGEDRLSYKELVQSYRTTVEIMNYANKVISKLETGRATLAEPVIRHGREPEIFDFSDEKSFVEKLVMDLEELEKNYSSIALVTKTQDESKLLQKLLRSYYSDMHIIDEKQEVFEAGISIVPSYLSKGLEFDAVLITSLIDDYREVEIDIKLLYVAMTRALHELNIYRLDDKLRLL